MDLLKHYLLVAFLAGFSSHILGQVTDCSGTCNLQFRCDPYAKNLVWTVSRGVCRVFQNPCFLGSHNCQRKNQCLQPLVSISQTKCMAHCPRSCALSGQRVCASFSYVDNNGVKRDRQITFHNLCHLEQYVCQNANAYIGDPSTGPCF